MPIGIYIRTKPPWNKGKKGVQKCPEWRKEKLKILMTGNNNPAKRLEVRKILSEQKLKYNPMKGKHWSDKEKKKRREQRLGKKHTEETKRKIGEAKKGNKCPFWKGGITPKNHLLRMSLENKLWRESVFEYDNYICWICRERGMELNAHHLLDFSDFSELRFVRSNGLTLCHFCHKTYTKFGLKAKTIHLASQQE